jgi:hypothetical protein
VRQQRDQLIHDQVQRLRESFGAERFPVVEAFVRAKAPDSSFFPLPGGAHATAKKAQ